MTRTPKVSVVMSVYNGERYLLEAVDSILTQTFTDFEFIIINDGSTDGTKDILESYNDPRIVLFHQEHKGLTKSLNKGISLAKGKYIARQDADDISFPERLEKQIDFLESHRNIALLGTTIELVNEKRQFLQKIEYPCDHSAIQKGLKQHNYFCHGSVMFTRQSFFELGGYREIFMTSQDYDLWLRFAERFEVANLSYPLYYRRLSIHSVTPQNIVIQRRMGIFARQLARAREKGIKENSLISELKGFLDLPLSLAEKKGIIYRYSYWSSWLLRQNRKSEAFILMDKGLKHHPSSLYKVLFKIAKVFQFLFLLKILLKYRSLFFIGK